MTSNNHGPLSSQGRGLELLAPAKNLVCGLAAIAHGADAVYIGADHFGARAAAGNSVDDIATLCTYAHRYGAKVYVTVNTIIYEDELAATQDLITSLARVGVDALLVQDMATLAMRRVALSAVGHAPGAIHIPMGDLPARLDELAPFLDGDGPLIVTCRSGGRVARVLPWLAQQGYEVADLDGGMLAWAAAGRPLLGAEGIEPSVS